MNKKESNICNHCLHHCSSCDRVYCSLCAQEWGGNYWDLCLEHGHG